MLYLVFINTKILDSHPPSYQLSFHRIHQHNGNRKQGNCFLYAVNIKTRILWEHHVKMCNQFLSFSHHSFHSLVHDKNGPSSLLGLSLNGHTTLVAQNNLSKLEGHSFHLNLISRLFTCFSFNLILTINYITGPLYFFENTHTHPGIMRWVGVWGGVLIFFTFVFIQTLTSTYTNTYCVVFSTYKHISCAFST